MGENSKIGWTHHTFNAWWGCHKVSPACTNCYAESFSKRTGHAVWGLKAPRRFFGEETWKKPLKWNRDAEKAGERRRVFCGSMMDVFELHPSPIESGMQLVARTRLWQLIDSTPALDWLLLTKRPENAEAVLPLDWWRNGLPPNVWMGTTVENQEYADLRIPHLLKIPARVRFLSCEPLLGPTRIDDILMPDRSILKPLVGLRWAPDAQVGDPPRGVPRRTHGLYPEKTGSKIHWVIAGGESGHHHREHRLEWSRSLRDQCAAAGTAFFFKQLGEEPTEESAVLVGTEAQHARNMGVRVPVRRRLPMKPRSKGESLDEIPPDLRIREFPT